MLFCLTCLPRKGHLFFAPVHNDSTSFFLAYIVASLFPFFLPIHDLDDLVLPSRSLPSPFRLHTSWLSPISRFEGAEGNKKHTIKCRTSSTFYMMLKPTPHRPVQYYGVFIATPLGRGPLPSWTLIARPPCYMPFETGGLWLSWKCCRTPGPGVNICGVR